MSATNLPTGTFPTLALDFAGNPRPDPGSNHFDVGAYEFQGTQPAVLTVSPTSLAFGSVNDGTTSAAQTLTLNNTGDSGATGIAVAVTSPFSRPTGAAGGTCGATLAAGLTCTINIVFSPPVAASNTPYSGTATITASATVNGSPVSLSGTGVVPVTRTATVTPTSLAFPNTAVGTTSAAMTVTVTNTGNTALAGSAFTFGGGTPQPFSRPAGAAGGTCGAGLAVGASCTINVVFRPTTATALSRTLAVAYTGATVTGSPVTLTGTGIQGTLSFTAATNGTLTTTGALTTLNFTIPTPRAAVTSVVTITNTGGASLQITAEALAINIGGLYSITGNTCSFTTPLAPNGTCTVSIRYATPAARPTNPDIGLATFTNNGSGTLGGVTGLGLSGQ